jgi:hypothetical protein
MALRATSNHALQRRPRSEFLINIGVSHAAPLNAGVRPLYSKSTGATIGWLRRKKDLAEMGNSLEIRVTQGKVSYITTITYDPINKSIEICFVSSPENTSINRILRLKKVEGFSEARLEPLQSGELESLIGLDEYTEEKGTRYVMHTDARELIFLTNQEPEIERR